MTSDKREEAGTATPPVPVMLDLAALGGYTAADAQSDSYARILLLGPAKSGKTTSIVTTAPKPVIINCDGQSALKYPAKKGAEFLAFDAHTRAEWKKAVGNAIKCVEAGAANTIVVDTISLLCDDLLDEITVTMTGWDVWTELATCVMQGIKRLMKAQAHLFVISHMTPDSDAAAGIMPAIGGKLKIRLPAILDDWILLDVEADRKPHERLFLLGPQKSWTHSGRNVKRTCAIQATVPALFEELGIPL